MARPLFISLRNVAADDSLVVIQDNTAKMNNIFEKMESDFKDHSDIMRCVRGLAEMYRPLDDRSLNVVEKLRTFSREARRSWLALFLRLVREGATDKVDMLLRMAVRELNSIGDELDELAQGFQILCNHADTLAKSAADQSQKANLRIKENREHEENCKTVAVVGFGVECGGAAGILAVGAAASNPVGWCCLLGGAAATITFAVMGQQSENDSKSQALVHKHGLELSQIMTVVNANLQRQRDHSTLVKKQIEKNLASAGCIPELMDEPEFVEEEVGNLIELFHEMERKCDAYMVLHRANNRRVFRTLCRD